jgi:leucyl aminopeptidase
MGLITTTRPVTTTNRQGDPIVIQEQGWNWVGIVASALVLIVLLLTCMVGCAAGVKEYGRYQKRADAQNEVRITAIQIQNQAQRVQIAHQQAEIRLQEAIGVRKAQDEISGTLTPLYVQHEMIQALKESGAATVYIPTDPASGLPVVTTRNAGGK